MVHPFGFRCVGISQVTKLNQLLDPFNIPSFQFLVFLDSNDKNTFLYFQVENLENYSERKNKFN